MDYTICQLFPYNSGALILTGNNCSSMDMLSLLLASYYLQKWSCIQKRIIS